MKACEYELKLEWLMGFDSHVPRSNHYLHCAVHGRVDRLPGDGPTYGDTWKRHLREFEATENDLCALPVELL
jgi:hypothetical protein